VTPRRPRELISEEEIRDRVDALAAEISDDYRNGDPLVMIGILKGAFVLLSDLARRVTVPRRIEFMALSSYDGTERASGAVRLLMDLRTAIEGRDVLVVEDIVDTGQTLEYLLETLGARRPASLSTCVLVRKRSASAGGPPVDYLGFEIPDEWVVGYGLDYRERYRTLPYIGILDPEELEPSDRA
jgi:hypoxanthine phosphoribosyltransferase